MNDSSHERDTANERTWSLSSPSNGVGGLGDTKRSSRSVRFASGLASASAGAGKTCSGSPYRRTDTMAPSTMSGAHSAAIGSTISVSNSASAAGSAARSSKWAAWAMSASSYGLQTTHAVRRRTELKEGDEGHESHLGCEDKANVEHAAQLVARGCGGVAATGDVRKRGVEVHRTGLPDPADIAGRAKVRVRMGSLPKAHDVGVEDAEAENDRWRRDLPRSERFRELHAQ